jgi:hypothetical protein
VPLTAVQEWLAGSRLVRSVADSVLRGRARWHLARLEQLPVGRTQSRVLLDLVRQAGSTRFGRDHDFGRIRRVEDFRRLVPLRRPAELWQAYGQPPGPYRAGVTWPGPLHALADCGNGAASHVAVSSGLLALHRRTLWTALALVLTARPRARVCRGRVLIVGDLEALAVRCGPALLRPYVLGPQLDADADRLLRLARQAGCLPVTCLVGDAGQLLELLAHLRDLTGRDGALEVWPELAAVLYHGGGDADRARLAEAVGAVPGRDPVLLLERWFRPEGTVAVEDPRHGLPRLLPDHGVYFEFVPAAEANRPDAPRHGLTEVEPGVAYEIALTSPAGWWACRTGLTVRFERRDPPLLRLVSPAPASVPTPATAPATRADLPRTPHPLQPPHPRTAGSPAALPGMPFHTPWSAPVDRG